MHRHLAITAVTISALLGLAACSSDSSDTKEIAPDAQPTTPAAPNRAADDGTAALEKAVRDYTAAYFKPDAGTGYAMLSARCQDEVNEAMYGTQLEQAHLDYGALNVKTFAVDQISGDLARVTYGVGVPLLDQKAQPWVRESGQWHWDAC